jgi:hypothetical protein
MLQKRGVTSGVWRLQGVRPFTRTILVPALLAIDALLRPGDRPQTETPDGAAAVRTCGVRSVSYPLQGVVNGPEQMGVALTESHSQFSFLAVPSLFAQVRRFANARIRSQDRPSLLEKLITPSDQHSFVTSEFLLSHALPPLQVAILRMVGAPRHLSPERDGVPTKR